MEFRSKSVLTSGLRKNIELVLGCRRASRVVRRAEVDDVRARGVLEVREEVVARVARHVDDVLVLLLILVHLGGLPHDHRRVDVDGIGPMLGVTQLSNYVILKGSFSAVS